MADLAAVSHAPAATAFERGDTALAAQLSQELRMPVDPAAAPYLDESAKVCVSDLGTWLTERHPTYGVTLRDVRLRHWRSVEDPGDHSLVVDVMASGEEASVQRLWTDASIHLGTLVKAHPSPATERLTLTVRRQ